MTRGKVCVVIQIIVGAGQAGDALPGSPKPGLPPVSPRGLPTRGARRRGDEALCSLPIVPRAVPPLHQAAGWLLIDRSRLFVGRAYINKHEYRAT
jgi:hypothetical protein